MNTNNHLTLHDFLFVSVSVPEKLDYFINRYAEHLHEKWSMDKVMENTISPVTR